jgi:DNA-binding winged helix-turn-helix (wHTH) protein
MLCPHCFGRLDRQRTVLPQPWFDDDRHEVIVDGDRRHLTSSMWRLLVIFWERAERLVPEPVLMDLLYAGNASISQTDSFRVQICRLRRALVGAPFRILNEYSAGYMLTGRFEVPPRLRKKTTEADPQKLRIPAAFGISARPIFETHKKGTPRDAMHGTSSRPRRRFV